MAGSSSCIKANRLTSITTSVTGRYFCTLCTRLICVCTRCLADGVSHPSGLRRLQKRAWVFRMTLQVINASAAYCGSFRILIPPRIIVPYFFASRCLALRSPFREARRHWRRFSISFAISLFLVSTAADSRRFPFRSRAANPILVRPGSSARITGWRTGSLS